MSQGVAPFGQDMAVLAYVSDEDSSEGAENGGAKSPAANGSTRTDSLRPEV